MNCAEIGPSLFAFADGELSVARHFAVLDHLRTCGDCTGIVADQLHLRAAVRLLLEGEPVPDGLLPRVMQRLASDQAARLVE